ncbi:hypothetical protein NDU88_005367 [Pleurodeles waltl]|uniref:SHSP domain-containing protein n=1 Tax=Pleurodeles waltl TaxID=8319 RepID=A0AAV7W9D4_PLEWA|nr:hypothetical protein NDU88_005367 [Pleurodeles waltl]
MEGSTVRHWVETPARYSYVFTTKPPEEHTLDHSLFALPGPSVGNRGKQQNAVKAVASELEKTGLEGQAHFHILLDVVQFRPEDILIQIFEGWLVVKAQHGRRMDEHGFISRRFTRTYKLPHGVRTRDLSAVLCHDGILCVELKKRV